LTRFPPVVSRDRPLQPPATRLHDRLRQPRAHGGLLNGRHRLPTVLALPHTCIHAYMHAYRHKSHGHACMHVYRHTSHGLISCMGMVSLQPELSLRYPTARVIPPVFPPTIRRNRALQPPSARLYSRLPQSRAHGGLLNGRHRLPTTLGSCRARSLLRPARRSRPLARSLRAGRRPSRLRRLPSDIYIAIYT